MKNKNILTILFLMLVLTVISCGNSNKKSDRIDAVEKEVVKAPEFNADSAYAPPSPSKSVPMPTCSIPMIFTMWFR